MNGIDVESLAVLGAQTAHDKSPTKRNPRGFASGEVWADIFVG